MEYTFNAMGQKIHFILDLHKERRLRKIDKRFQNHFVHRLNRAEEPIPFNILTSCVCSRPLGYIEPYGEKKRLGCSEEI